jgi:Tfp pilus assembly protein PilO
MNTAREYRVPILIGVGTLVVALLLWAVLISSQTSKVSSLQAQEAQLNSQQLALQAKLSGLKSEKQQVPNSCADLQKIATQIPSVQSPTDIDAEESSFESQFNALTASTGVVLTQFSGFAPATTTSAPTTPTNTSATGKAPVVVAVPTTLTVGGTYGQIMSFVNGLDNFPRLFVIQKFVLTAGGTPPGTTATGGTAAGGAGSSASGSSSIVTPSESATPLWTGGATTSQGAGPYYLSITGSIYYTTTPNALDSCVKATEAIKQG